MMKHIYQKKNKRNDKLPDKIKISLDKGKTSEKEFNNQNKLSELINDCINIENNILFINQTNQEIKKAKKEMNTKIKFYPEKSETINNILSNIIKFGELYKEKFSCYFEKELLNIEINSLTENDKIVDKDCFSVELCGFTQEQYDLLYSKNIKYGNDDIIITFILEGKDQDSLDSIINILTELIKELGVNEYSPLTFSFRKCQND